MHNIKSRYPKNVAGWMFAFIWSIQGIQFVQKEEIDALKSLYSDLITDTDDVPHIHAYLARECDYFVTTDRRLIDMKINEKVNFKSPKSFLQILGVDGHDTVVASEFHEISDATKPPHPPPHNLTIAGQDHPSLDIRVLGAHA